VKTTWVVPFINVGGNVGEDDFGVGGGATGVSGYLGMLEDTVNWVESAFEERGETVRASEGGRVESAKVSLGLGKAGGASSLGLGVAEGFGLGSGGEDGRCPGGEGFVGFGVGRRERGSGQDVIVGVSGCS
jgi:hypothetical protein